MKRFLAILLGLIMIISLTACGSKGGNNSPSSSVTPPEESEVNIDDTFTRASKTLVVYFSKTNTTESVAKLIQSETGADIFEIERKEPYPDAYTPTTEVAKDEKDANARPELKTYLPKDVIAGYDTIFVGFPIWWGTAPMPVLSFLNFYDFSGKTIYTFCTAASSSISGSTADIRSNASGANVVEGKRFSRNDESGVKSWIVSLNWSNPDTPDVPDTPTEATASLTYERNDNGYTVTGETENVENIIIPAEYDGLPVTEIGESAFAYSRHNEDILSVTIPDSVTTIALNAFYNRDEMTTVTIGQNSELTTIGRNAFSGNSSLKAIYIPSGVTTIGDSAFNNDGAINFTVAEGNVVYRSENGHLIETATKNLIRGGQSAFVPESVTSIAQAAFRRSAITEIDIPASVTVIGNYFIADSIVTVINFGGTEEQWNSIEKGRMWNYGKSDIEIKFKGEVAKILVVYFSGSGNTERVAGYIAEATGGTLFELVPVTPYTSADLNYTNQSSRVYQEYLNESLRDTELVSYTVENWETYDTVFIGYPIWWGIAAWPVNNFIKNNDFSGKTVIPFCTSASSGLGQSGTLLAEMAGTGDWQTGMRFSSSASQSTVVSWVSGLGLAA